MAITNVNGSLLKKMVMNGAINLKNNYKEIDLLNVFPVPDGDTGTNMQMTMMAGVREINSGESNSVIEISKTLSRELLMGARGNSGVILSQFFRGIYVGMKEIRGANATIAEFINCLVSGYQVAYKAVKEPVEGTILTVVREAATYTKENQASCKTIEDVLKTYLEEARRSLARTPQLLPVLKEAGVVDSGGAGFVKVVEGMLMAVQGRILESEIVTDTTSVQQVVFEMKDIKFGYCTEFIVELKNPDIFDEADLRSPLSLIGDSLVLVKDEDLLKVHVHTNSPGRALNMAQRYGEFISIKVENMRLQHSEVLNANAVVPKERRKYGLIAVCFGEGIKSTFKELGCDYIIDGGQTMNPSTEEFVKAVKAVNADNIIIIPNNSNVILSAEQTTKLCPEENVHVLKAKTIAHGYASLMAFDTTISLEENVHDMQEAINKVKAGEVTFAVRDTEIKGVKIKAGDYMGITNGEIIVASETRLAATQKLLKDCITKDAEIVTLFYGLNVLEDEISKIENYCQELNSDIEVEVISGQQDIYSYIIAVE